MNSKPRIISAFGPTGVGKSSFVNTHTGKALAKVGDKKGHSTTKKLMVYSSGPFLYFDVPGGGDSSLDVSSKDIRDMVTDGISALGPDAQVVNLIFESFLADRIQLLITLNQFERVVGQNVFQSCIVVFTKHNLSLEIDVQRKQELEKICNDKQIPFIYWESDFDNYKVPSEKLNHQNRILSDLIDTRKFFSPEILTAKKREIELAIQNLQNTYPVEFENKTVPYVEEYEQPYQENVAKTRKVTRAIPKTITVQEQRSRTINVPKIESYVEKELRYKEEIIYINKKRGGIAGAFGGRKTITETKNVPYYVDVTKQRVTYENKLEYYNVDVQKTIHENQTFDETYYELENRTRKCQRNAVRTEQVQKPKPGLDFFRKKYEEMMKNELLKKYAVVA